MCNIWKIASRWSYDGNKNSSIIDIFRKYNIVFAGRKQYDIKRSVKPNDIIALSDGTTVVSVGKITDIPKPITEFNFDELDRNSGRFNYEEWVIGFKVNLYDLKSEDWFKYNRGTFHKVYEPHRIKIKSLFEKYNAYENKED
jgi:hypothetical protein